MRLVFVHGIHEEHKTPAKLRQSWESALLSAWSEAGLAKPRYSLEMPYYGNLLAGLAERVSGMAGRISDPQVAGLISRFQHDLAHDYGKLKGFDAARLGKQFAKSVVRCDIAECEWMQGILRFLDGNVPGFGPLFLNFTRQLDAYLTSPRVRAAVDDVVGPSLLDGPTVIVAHSLGSVIAYRLLRQMEAGAQVPLLVTLGSPLGICTIKEHLSPPALAMPAAVQTWLNATDEKDCVALHARLDRATFVAGIENVDDVHHAAGDPHAIADYLAHPTVAGRIHAALSGGAVSTRRARGAAPRARAASPRTCAPPHRTPG